MIQLAELLLPRRRRKQTLRDWLYSGVRTSILEGRLPRGALLPPSRAIAAQYSISRGTVVAALKQLEAEGYLIARRGSGTRVRASIPDDLSPGHGARRTAPTRRPRAPTGRWSLRPFRPDLPAVHHFPVETWARLSSKRVRRATLQDLANEDVGGLPALRAAIADSVGPTRGVRCTPDQVAVTSGIQQGLDLCCRMLVESGSSAWVEDPGYHGAVSALRRAGAELVPIPLDDEGLRVEEGWKRAPHARLAVVTPAHQFATGVAMSVARRLQLLQWARDADAYVLEDDYDSEFRYEGRPLPALAELDAHGRVILLGTFNKSLFPGLRLGYVVLPDGLVEPYRRLRRDVERPPPYVSQAVLADFMAGGHFARHVRRSREIYAARLAALRESIAGCSAGEWLEIPTIPAGLCVPAYSIRGLSSQEI
ncbi:MAG: PLP-dependent aminotransferase family protein, partial [Proteobacteria bacterium]|nr:PLP-dependent aminotransferase family protein [Pseudomonadota bacterium]